MHMHFVFDPKLLNKLKFTFDFQLPKLWLFNAFEIVNHIFILYNFREFKFAAFNLVFLVLPASIRYLPLSTDI